MPIPAARRDLRTFAHAFTPPLNPLSMQWGGDFKMRFSPPLQVLAMHYPQIRERGKVG